MGFVKTSDEIANRLVQSVEFYDAETLTVFFETKSETIQRLLPPPLKATCFPMGIAFVAIYPETNIGLAYKESALMLAAEYRGENGLYTLGMVVDNDMALIGGREIFGYPKKMGNISLVQEGSDFKCSTERHEILFMEMKARLEGAFNDRNIQVGHGEKLTGFVVGVVNLLGQGGLRGPGLFNQVALVVVSSYSNRVTTPLGLTLFFTL